MCFFCLSQKPTGVRSHLPEATSGTLPCAGSSPGYTEARAPGPLSLRSLLSDPTWLCGAGSWRRHTPIRRTKQHGGPHPDLGPSHPLRVPSHFQLQGAGSGALRPGLSLPGTSGTLRERDTPALDGLQLVAQATTEQTMQTAPRPAILKVEGAAPPKGRLRRPQDTRLWAEAHSLQLLREPADRAPEPGMGLHLGAEDPRPPFFLPEGAWGLGRGDGRWVGCFGVQRV